jgi:hypothetical protein
MSVSHPKNVGDQRLPAISDLLQIQSQAFQHGRDRLQFGNVDAGDGPIEGAAKCDLFLARAASSRSRCAIGVGGAGGLEPTGVLVETKVDIRRRAEGKAQLGIWLAAWYGRVAKFAPLPSGDSGTPTNLPFLPVLLVVCENWELYFAFDREGEFEVCGPLEVGSTVAVDGSYRLLEVLRLLASWVAGDFRGWVERCIA